MKIRSILFILGVTFSQFSLAQQTLPRDPDCCTSIMVGKLASTDGSVMTSHTCDSWYRTWVNVVPAADFANDTVMNIYDGRMHTESVNDQTKLTVKGQIPQAGLRNLSFHGQFRLVVDRFRVHASVVNVHHCVVGKICCRYYVYPRTVPAIAGVACHDRAVS